MKTIYCDIDGTLLSGVLDNEFIARNYDMAWYNAQHVTTLAVNMDLARTLALLKEEGCKLVLWTNRGKEQYDMTKENLGVLWYLFDEHQFHSGKKLGTNVDGFTFDNEAKYLTGAGQLINW